MLISVGALRGGSLRVDLGRSLPAPRSVTAAEVVVDNLQEFVGERQLRGFAWAYWRSCSDARSVSALSP